MYNSPLARFALTEEHLVTMEWQAVWAPDHRLNILEKRKIFYPYRYSNHDSPNKFRQQIRVLRLNWRTNLGGCSRMAAITVAQSLVLSILNPLNPEVNPICYLLALLAHHFLHVSRIRVKSLTLKLLMSYIYGAPILDVSRSHITTQHSR